MCVLGRRNFPHDRGVDCKLRSCGGIIWKKEYRGWDKRYSHEQKGHWRSRHVPTCVKVLSVGNDKCQTDKTSEGWIPKPTQVRRPKSPAYHRSFSQPSLSPPLQTDTSFFTSCQLCLGLWHSDVALYSTILPSLQECTHIKGQFSSFPSVASGGPWKSQVTLKTTAHTVSPLSNVGRVPAFFISHYNKNDNKHCLIHLSGVKIFFFRSKKSISLSKKCLIDNFSCSKGNKLRIIEMKAVNFLAPANIWQPVWWASTL